MAIELEHRFGRDSRVRDYWLAASEGFAVQSADGRRVGTVRQVVHERDGKAAALVVEARRGLARTEEVVLEAEVVEEVAPWRSTLVVPPDEAPEPGPNLARRSEHVLVEVVAGVAEAVRTFAVRRAADVRRRWPTVRGAVVAVLAASSRFAVATTRGAVAAVRTHWPGVKAGGRHAWSSTVAVLGGFVAAVAELLGRMRRALVRRGAAARSTPRP